MVVVIFRLIAKKQAVAELGQAQVQFDDELSMNYQACLDKYLDKFYGYKDKQDLGLKPQTSLIRLKVIVKAWYTSFYQILAFGEGSQAEG